MAQNYTTEEITAAVAKLVRTSIDRTYGSLGNRKTDISFGQIQDAAAGVFILYPNSPFYISFLASALLDGEAQATEVSLANVTDAIFALTRRTTPITDLTSLANARSALAALSAASSSRSSALSSLEAAPAWKRFEQSTNAFLADASSNIQSGANIVQTPEQARSALGGLISALKVQYTEVVRRVKLLQKSIDDFDTMNLAASFSNFIIQNAASVTDANYQMLQSLTPEARLAALRSVTLDVLAARSTVRGFGAMNPTTSYLYFSGQGQEYSDPAHLLTPAILANTFPEYYALTPGHTRVDLTVDGGTALVANISVDLPLSYIAQIDGVVVGPNYTFADGTGVTVQNNQLVVRCTGQTDVTVTFPPGSPSTQQVADVINTALGGGHPVTATPYGPQLYLQGEPVDIAVFGPITVQVSRHNTLNWSGVITGDWLYISDAVNAGNLGWWMITGVSAGFILAARPGSSPVAELAATASLNKGAPALRLTFKDAQQLNSLYFRWAIACPATSDAVKSCLNTLGIIQDVSISSEPTKAQTCVDFINKNPAIVVNGAVRVKADKAFYQEAARPGRSEPTDPTKLVFAYFTSVANITTAGLTAIFSVPTPSNFHSGMIMVIRESSQSGQIGNWGTVTSIGTTTITVLMHAAIPAIETGVKIEACANATNLAHSTIFITSSPTTLNDGTYESLGLDGTVTDIDSNRAPVAVVLARALPVPSSYGNQPVAFQTSVGRYRITFASASAQVGSSISALATTTAPLWSVLPQGQLAQSPFFQLAEAPKQVEVNDLLELHTTAAATPTFLATITRVETNPNVLTLDTLLPAGSWTMAQDSQAPYGRIRKVHKNNFETLKTSLTSWLALPQANVTTYFNELQRLLNPVLVNTNPKAVDIQTLVNYLFTLQTQLELLRTDLNIYEAPIVPQVDVMLDTLLQSGASRAVDLLLEGQFSVFFGLDQNSTSYAGNVSSNLRAVSMNDLPISKTGRGRAPEMIASYTDTNFEYSKADTEEVDVSQVGDAYSRGSGSAF